MLTLFYAPGACSLASHLMLEETGATYETVRVNLAEGAQRAPDYLRMNPHGRVPVLRDGDFVLTESIAILSYLGHLFPQSGLLPLGDAKSMARLEEMLSFCAAWVHPAVAQVWRTARFAESAAAQAEIQAAGKRSLLGYLEEIEAMAGRGQWFLGDRLSVADFYPVVFYRWGRRMELDMARYGAWSAHTARMLARPATQRVLPSEGLAPADFQPALAAA